nr:unnamed protein product [Naegleria fowleri]
MGASISMVTASHVPALNEQDDHYHHDHDQYSILDRSFPPSSFDSQSQKEPLESNFFTLTTSTRRLNNGRRHTLPHPPQSTRMFQMSSTLLSSAHERFSHNDDSRLEPYIQTHHLDTFDSNTECSEDEYENQDQNQKVSFSSIKKMLSKEVVERCGLGSIPSTDPKIHTHATLTSTRRNSSSQYCARPLTSKKTIDSSSSFKKCASYEYKILVTQSDGEDEENTPLTRRRISIEEERKELKKKIHLKKTTLHFVNSFRNE